MTIWPWKLSSGSLGLHAVASLIALPPPNRASYSKPNSWKISHTCLLGIMPKWLLIFNQPFSYLFLASPKQRFGEKSVIVCHSLKSPHPMGHNTHLLRGETYKLLKSTLVRSLPAGNKKQYSNSLNDFLPGPGPPARQVLIILNKIFCIAWHKTGFHFWVKHQVSIKRLI